MKKSIFFIILLALSIPRSLEMVEEAKQAHLKAYADYKEVSSSSLDKVQVYRSAEILLEANNARTRAILIPVTTGGVILLILSVSIINLTKKDSDYI